MIGIKWHSIANVAISIALLLSVTIPYGSQSAEAASARIGERVVSIAGGSSLRMTPEMEKKVIGWGDEEPPVVQFSPNGNASPSKIVESTVIVTDAETAVDQTLHYAWTQSADVPTDGWTDFSSGDTLTHASGDGNWYLHVRTIDLNWNIDDVVSNVFVLDNTAPILALNGGNSIAVEANSVFADPGATAEDVQDGDLTTVITVTGAVYTYRVGNYTLYYNVSDSAGNAATSVSRAVYVQDTQPPVLALLGDPVMRLAYGATFNDPGATATDAYSGDVTDQIIVTGAVDTHQTGTYTLRYNVQDPTGNAAAEVTRRVTVSRKKTSDNDQGTSVAQFPPVITKQVIDLNGSSLDPATIDTTKSSFTLEVTPKDGKAYVSIPAHILTDFAGENATFFIEIKTPYGSYQVPANLVSLIPRLDNMLAANQLTAEDISFKITLTDKFGDKGIRTAFAEGLPNGKVIGAFVDFHIDIVNTKTGQSIGIADQFSKALTRIIPMPRDITRMSKQWGAFRYNDTNHQFEFVPARAVQIDDTWFVMISSYTNSVYVVADHAVSFADMQKHWGQPFVGLAAAKGLVQGVGGGKYNPDQVVTRAEFATMLVRALGSRPSSGSAAPYDDVQPGAWYYVSVVQARGLGLLGFASGKQFMPNQPLTRVEMAEMLTAAMKLKNPLIHDGSVNLDGYKDIGSLSSDELGNVGIMVKLGIMQGMDAETFAPRSTTTRAQAAIVLVKTLQTLGMID